MGQVGNQDFWIVGSRMYFQRDQPTGGNPQPLLDMGVIQQANPTLTPTAIRLFDSDGGQKAIVDETVTQMEEVYEVTCSNINNQNLAFLFLSTDPSTFTQSPGEVIAAHYVTAGYLVKLLDTSGVPVFNIRTVNGVYSTAGVVVAHTINAMTAGTNVISLTGNFTALYTVGVLFIVTGLGLANSRNAGTYKVTSSTFSTPNTLVTVDATYNPIFANEVAITGATVTNSAGATIYSPVGAADWETSSLTRGMIRIAEAGAIVTGNVNISFTLETVTQGQRLIKPQSQKDSIKGKMWLFYSRQNFSRENVRECLVSLVPSGTNFVADGFSDITFTVTVRSDLTAADPAGRLLQSIGTTLPLSAVQESTPQGD